jgi:hypothetical protein
LRSRDQTSQGELAIFEDQWSNSIASPAISATLGVMTSVLFMSLVTWVPSQVADVQWEV